MLNQTATTISILRQAFDVPNFRTWGHQLIDLLADHLQNVQTDPDALVLPYQTQKELEFWQQDFQAGWGSRSIYLKTYYNILLTFIIRIISGIRWRSRR